MSSHVFTPSWPSWPPPCWGPHYKRLANRGGGFQPAQIWNFRIWLLVSTAWVKKQHKKRLNEQLCCKQRKSPHNNIATDFEDLRCLKTKLFPVIKIQIRASSSISKSPSLGFCTQFCLWVRVLLHWWIRRAKCYRKMVFDLSSANRG